MKKSKAETLADALKAGSLDNFKPGWDVIEIAAAHLRAQDALIGKLVEALKLADATLSGANMNRNVVQIKAREALAKAEAAR